MFRKFSNKKSNFSKGFHQDIKLILAELNEDPYRKFHLAFALMSIIPLLVFLYVVAVEFFTIDVLVGKIGLIMFLTIIITLIGYYVGYMTIRNILIKIIAYATSARHSDYLKTTFVATASHELKNPIAILKSNIYNMKEGFLGEVSEQQSKVLQLCYDVLQRMTRLVTGLLDMYKVEDKMDGLLITKCDLTSVLEKQLNELEGLVNEKEHTLIRDIPKRKVIAWIDEGKFERIVHNIVSNAVKYTPNKGTIKVSMFDSGEFVRFECEDNGVGIPEDKKERIFDKFVRLVHSKEGTGLGLAITKELVELHNGKIIVESELQKGSKFIVILPLDMRKLKGA